jgi:hypothetical protein
MAETDLIQQRKMWVRCLYLLSGLWGFHSALNTTPQTVDLPLTLTIAIVVTLICLVEARIQRKPIPTLAGWLILVSWPLSVPLCLFWLRGRRQSLRLMLSLFAVTAIYFGGAIVASMIAPE